jgi:hypothetical protein
VVVAILSEINNNFVLLKIHIGNRAFTNNLVFVLGAAMSAWEIEHCA